MRITKDAKDERFDSLKKSGITFMGAWTIQALWVLLIQTPVLLVNDTDDNIPSSAIDALAAAGWIVGFCTEFLADVQKFTFRADPVRQTCPPLQMINYPNQQDPLCAPLNVRQQANRHKFITSGMWRYSRHPNYFGEILMWLSLTCSVASAGWRSTDARLLGRHQLAWLSPVFTMILLLGVSGMPMVETAGRKKWGGQPEYEHYMNHTSAIIPWSPASPLLQGDEPQEKKER